MKRWFFLFTISLLNMTFASPLQNRKIERDALIQLTSAFNISQDSDLIAETQKQWLRSAHQERWEMKELSFDQKTFVLNWARNQGMFAECKPSNSYYDKALILGGTTSVMQMRLDYLKKLWEEGVCFKEIVWLTGQRPLDPRVDGFTERCNTESEAAHILWQETPLPQKMCSLPVTFIEVPMKAGGKRPNTQDTLIAWIEQSEPCKALFVSTQPFCGYQFSIIKATLPTSFLFDVVGPGLDPNSHPAAAAITLDSIARWIYQDSLCP